MQEVVLLMAERRGLHEELRARRDRLRDLGAGAGPAVVALAETARLVAELEGLFARVEEIELALLRAGEVSCLN